MHDCTFFTTWSSWLKEIISAGSVGEQSALHTRSFSFSSPKARSRRRFRFWGGRSRGNVQCMNAENGVLGALMPRCSARATGRARRCTPNRLSGRDTV